MKNYLSIKNLNLDFYKITQESNLERQLDKLPKEIIFCKKCVVSNQRPRIVFDAKGICSACNWFEEKKKIDWSLRKKEFLTLIEKHKKK